MWVDACGGFAFRGTWTLQGMTTANARAIQGTRVSLLRDKACTVDTLVKGIAGSGGGYLDPR